MGAAVTHQRICLVKVIPPVRADGLLAWSWEGDRCSRRVSKRGGTRATKDEACGGARGAGGARRTSDVPHVQFEFALHEGLDVESLRRSDVRRILWQSDTYGREGEIERGESRGRREIWAGKRTSSESFFRIVVFPALSRPSTRSRASLSFFFSLRRRFRSPIFLSSINY